MVECKVNSFVLIWDIKCIYMILNIWLYSLGIFIFMLFFVKLIGIIVFLFLNIFLICVIFFKDWL